MKVGLLADHAIRKLAISDEMIVPFAEGERRPGIISFGLSSYGYDMRVAREFKLFTAATGALSVIDPKHFDNRLVTDFTGDECIIPPHSFALARSVEYFKLPRNVLGLVLGKSTYARTGIVTNFTPLEPGWHGHVTIEISNTTPLPAKIYAGEGIAQVLFFVGSTTPQRTYADKRGKYQGQIGVVTPRVV